MALTDEQVRAIVDDEVRSAVGYNSSELSSQRQLALEYYYGEPFGNEVEGRSSYVSRDVADTIEWVMPSLMRIFTGGDNIVRFEPQGPEDEKNAQQATDYVNYIFQRQNDGFLTLYTWFKDALLSKNGFVKVYWEEYTEQKTETYDALSEDEFAFLLKDVPEEDILEHSAYPGQMGMLHAVKFKLKSKTGKCCVIPVPPEEVLVSRYPVSPLKRNRFICHRRRVTPSEIVEMGLLSKEEAEKLTSFEDQDYNQERIARFAFDETDQGDTASDNASIKYVWLVEAYMKLDVDDDGIAELRKITLAGNKLLENEEADSIPFVSITPIILPHKLYGMSLADLVLDLQLLKSTVFRQILDNMYLANNGRYMALDGMVNIDDLLTSRPGGIVRVKTFDAVKPMQPPLLGAPAFNLLEYIDTIKENRTGVTRYNQGLDSESLNKTATGINQIMSAAQSRIELIARVFAETGVKDLFYAILENVQKHQSQPQVIRLRNEWVPMDPREWTSKFDLTVTVGLGTGSKESQIVALADEAQFQLMAIQSGLPIVLPENVYNLRMKALEAKNIKGGDLFYTHPSKMPPPPPQQNPDAIKVELEKMKGEMKSAMQQMKDENKTGQMAMKHEQDKEKEVLKAQLAERQQAQQQMADMEGQRREHMAQARENEMGGHRERVMKLLDMIVQSEQVEQQRGIEEQKAKLDSMLSMIQDNSKAQTDMLLRVLEAAMAERETEVAERDAKGKVRKTVSRVKKKG